MGAHEADECRRVLYGGPLPDETWYRLQVSGEEQSKHLNITGRTLALIATLLESEDSCEI